ncbi:PAC2 family-domain-containing protein [Infundibulicybe gibba]|nr:PAC2 family-domain-containing protein [Infundibulicybe gibba]
MSTPFYIPVGDVGLAGKTIIIPVVSIANVAQLAADLLISNLSLQHIGIFNPAFLIPAVGGREDGQEGITTPLELYGKPDSNFLLVQQRSPSQKQAFVGELWNFIKSSNIGCVLLLSGLDPTNRTDSQMLTPIYQLQPPNSPSLESSPLQALVRLSIPIYTPPFAQSGSTVLPFIPDSGLTRRILSSIPLGLPTPTASLLQFVLEGDNRADAQHLAATVISALGGNPGTIPWTQPNSWKHGLFGTPHDQTLYG